MKQPLDYQVIIAWNSNSEFCKIVRDTFKEEIIFEKSIQLSKEDRAKTINEVYAPIHVPHNSERCLYTEPITLFLIKMEPKYKYYLRAEGYLLCNSNIMSFKAKYRKQFHFNIFHCSDSIEETKKALNAFNLKADIPKCAIVNIKDIYHIRHLKNGSIAIAPMIDGVTVQYLIGYSLEDLNDKYGLYVAEDGYQDGYQDNGYIIGENTFKYLDSLKFTQENSLYPIKGYKYKDKYIITDGKHRSSYLYFHGDRHIFMYEDAPPCSNKIVDKSILPKDLDSHLEQLHSFIYEMNNKNIKHIIIRGWQTMPKTADTDLDIVIHPDDYQRFLELMKEYIKQHKFAFNVEVLYSDFYQAWYRAYRTQGIHNEFLTNKGYQLDTYNNVFFFGSNKTAITLNKSFLDNLFQTKRSHYNLWIPNEISEMILLYCRTYIDLNGNWKAKHKKRFLSLAQNVLKQDFITLLNNSVGDNARHIISHVEEAFK